MNEILVTILFILFSIGYWGIALWLMNKYVWKPLEMDLL